MLTLVVMPLGVGHRLALVLRVELLDAPAHQVLPARLHRRPHGARVQRRDLACGRAASVSPACGARACASA